MRYRIWYWRLDNGLYKTDGADLSVENQLILPKDIKMITIDLLVSDRRTIQLILGKENADQVIV